MKAMRTMVVMEVTGATGAMDTIISAIVVIIITTIIVINIMDITAIIIMAITAIIMDTNTASTRLKPFETHRDDMSLVMEASTIKITIGNVSQSLYSDLETIKGLEALTAKVTMPSERLSPSRMNKSVYYCNWLCTSAL